MKRLFSLVLFFLFCFLAAGEIEFYVLGTTDTHGRTFPQEPSWEQLALLIRQRKQAHPDAVLVDCGDTFQGSHAAFATRGRIFAELLVKLEYDLFVPGNHDFEFGGKALQANLQALGKKCTVLAANLEPWDGERNHFCWIRQTGAVKVGFIGLTETQIAFRLPADELAPFRLRDEKESLARAVSLLKAQDVHTIVLLRHNGLYSRSGSLAELIRPYPEIKLVLGGHSHEFNPGGKVGHALYLQAGSHAKALAEAVLVFNDKSGQFLQCRARLYPAAGDTAKDPEITDFLKKRTLRLPYRKKRFAISEGRRLPSHLGLEAMRQATKADAAILRTAKEEHPLPEEASIFQLYRAFPYANRVLVVELSRADFHTLLAEQKNQDQRDKFQRLAVLDYSKKSAASIRVALPDYLLAGGGRDAAQSVLKSARNIQKNPPCLLDAVVALLTGQAVSTR